MACPSTQPQLPDIPHSIHPLALTQSSAYSKSSPSLLPSPLVPRRLNTPSRDGFTCTWCGNNSPLPCFTVGRGSRAVCKECWKWMWSVRICWSCGEIVFRKTDAIGFGWCWWHWSCFSCLVCSVSLQVRKNRRVLTALVSASSSRLSRLGASATRRWYHCYRAACLPSLQRLTRFDCEARTACRCIGQCHSIISNRGPLRIG
jgi:hypothetical protein